MFCIVSYGDFVSFNFDFDFVLWVLDVGVVIGSVGDDVEIICNLLFEVGEIGFINFSFINF